MNIDEIYKVLSETLGLNGRMLSGSKSTYYNMYPDHITVFNANIVVKLDTGEFEKIWYGDVDITLDENALKSVALDAGCELYVLYEMDGRFEFEDSPRIDNYVFMTNGIESIMPEGEYNKFTRNEEGQIVRA